MPVHSKPAHSAGLTAKEYALFCYLRLHPDVAATYGITTCKQDCSGCQRRKTCAGVSQKTTIGWMLMQTLEAQGMNVSWYDRLPNGVSADGKGNEAGAAWIKSVTRRPGARMKPLTERPEVAPPDHSAVQRKHGRLPRVAFPLLVKLSKARRDRKFTNCGNRMLPLAETALVERRLLVDWVEKQCACQHCGKRLRLSKLTSHQVGACARVHFVCENSCARLKALETSKAMHGDDYELNSLLNYAIATCALSFARVVPALELLGLRAVSTTDHYNFKVTPRSAPFLRVRTIFMPCAPPSSRSLCRLRVSPSSPILLSARWQRRTRTIACVATRISSLSTAATPRRGTRTAARVVRTGRMARLWTSSTSD